MKKTPKLLFGLLLVAAVASCSKSDDNGDEPNNEYKLVNNGNGAVASIVDLDDDVALSVVQTSVPKDYYFASLAMEKNKAFSSARGGLKSGIQKSASVVELPANTPIIIFFNDKILLSAILPSISVTVDGNEVTGVVSINEESHGYAVLTFAPWNAFKSGQTVVVTIKSSMQDDGGNSMNSDVVMTFKATGNSNASFDGNTGFEKGDEGVVFMGDGAVRSGAWGDVGPQAGSKCGVITSGYELTSENRSIQETTSSMILGPINKNISSVAFYYDFISAEFDDYVNSEYDDTAIIIVTGPNGAYTEVINTVNLIGYNNTSVNIPGMPDGGDDKAGHIGWTQKTINFDKVGTPAYITFTVTDVSDQILSSILLVDNITY